MRSALPSAGRAARTRSPRVSNQLPRQGGISQASISPRAWRLHAFGSTPGVHLRARLAACSATAAAIFNASDGVSAYEIFEVTATTIPRSRNVINDTTIPPNVSPSVADHAFVHQPRDGLHQVQDRNLNPRPRPVAVTSAVIRPWSVAAARRCPSPSRSAPGRTAWTGIRSEQEQSHRRVTQSFLARSVSSSPMEREGTLKYPPAASRSPKAYTGTPSARSMPA